jgi:hypothetical protein
MTRLLFPSYLQIFWYGRDLGYFTEKQNAELTDLLVDSEYLLVIIKFVT